MSNKKNLLIINGAQFGHSSGHYFFCKYLSDTFEIHYICFDRGLKRIVLEGVKVSYISFGGNSIQRINRLLKACIRVSRIVNPDILIVTYFKASFILSFFCCAKRKILDIRTGSLKRSTALRYLDNIYLRLQSTAFLSSLILSEGLRSLVGIPNSKSHIVPLGSEVYKSEQRNSNEISLLYVGSLDGRDIDVTIKGYSLFRKKHVEKLINCSYSIVGFGTENEILKVKSTIRDCGLNDEVSFLGRMSTEDLIPLFKRSNVGVVYIPITPWYTFQQATKLFEFTLSGMPVIATKTYENAIIVDDQNGVLINDSPEDFCRGLETIWERRNTYNSDQIRESVKDFTWENIVNNNLKPYLISLLEGK